MSRHFSNGTEGYAWMANWCDRCERDHTMHGPDSDGPGCEIMLRCLQDLECPEWLEGTGRLGDTYHCIEFKPCAACGEGRGDGDEPRPPLIPIHPDQGQFFDPDALVAGVPAGVLLDEGLPSVLNPRVPVLLSFE